MITQKTQTAAAGTEEEDAIVRNRKLVTSAEQEVGVRGRNLGEGAASEEEKKALIEGMLEPKASSCWRTQSQGHKQVRLA